MMLKFSYVLCKGTLKKGPFFNSIKALHIFFLTVLLFFSLVPPLKHAENGKEQS